MSTPLLRLLPLFALLLLASPVVGRESWAGDSNREEYQKESRAQFQREQAEAARRQAEQEARAEEEARRFREEQEKQAKAGAARGESVPPYRTIQRDWTTPQGVKKIEVSVVSWPRTARPPLRVRSVVEDGDGLPATYLELAGTYGRYRLPNLPEWVNQPPSGGASAVFRHRLFASGRLQIFQFGRDDLLPNFTLPYLLGYCEGLRELHKRRLTGLEETEFAGRSSWAGLFPCRLLRYQLLAGDQAVPLADLLVQTETALLIFRVEGDPEVFPQLLDSVDIAVGSIQALGTEP